MNGEDHAAPLSHRHRALEPRRDRRRIGLPPIHLVGRVVVQAGMRQVRIRLGRHRLNRPAVELQRVGQHRDAPRREVRLHHLVRERQGLGAAAALVGRPLLAPGRRVHVDLQPRRAGHVHRRVERQPHLDRVAQRIGAVLARVRHHLHLRYRRCGRRRVHHRLAREIRQLVAVGGAQRSAFARPRVAHAHRFVRRDRRGQGHRHGVAGDVRRARSGDGSGRAGSREGAERPGCRETAGGPTSRRHREGLSARPRRRVQLRLEGHGERPHDHHTL